MVRKLPGVLGAETGALGESFADGLLEYPQYTRPATFNGMEVPAVLLSGNHGAVDRWRREQSSSAPIACALTCSRAWSCPTPTGHFCNLYRPRPVVAAARYHKQLSAYRAPLARAL